MGGETSQFKKRRKKRRKDKAIIFDNVVIAEEESDYVIKDRKLRNKFAKLIPTSKNPT